MNKTIYLLLSLILMSACTHTQQKPDNTEGENNEEQAVEALIYPVHPPLLKERYMQTEQKYIYSYFDYDGNQYVTEWTLPKTEAYDKDKFIAVSEQCSEKVYHLFPIPLEKVKQKAATLQYREIALCITDAGYLLKDSEAFHPESVAILLSKRYSLGDGHVKAGGKITITGKHLNFIDTYALAQSCFVKHQYDYMQGADGRRIYINMEPLLANMTNCLQQAGLQTSNNVKQPGDLEDKSNRYFSNPEKLRPLYPPAL